MYFVNATYLQRGRNQGNYVSFWFYITWKCIKYIWLKIVIKKGLKRKLVCTWSEVPYKSFFSHIAQVFLVLILKTQSRPVVPGGAGGAMAPPNFGRSINPISTKRAYYAHYITYSHPSGFSNLPKALPGTKFKCIWRSSVLAENFGIRDTAPRTRHNEAKLGLWSLIWIWIFTELGRYYVPCFQNGVLC